MPEPYITTHRLRFNDTDALGHVNNAVFAVMVEQGRAELVRLAGIAPVSDGQMVVIVRLELDFVAEMTWPGEIRVETAVAALGTKSFKLQQQLIQDGTVRGRALSVLVVVDRATRKAVPLTADQRQSLERWATEPA